MFFYNYNSTIKYLKKLFSKRTLRLTASKSGVVSRMALNTETCY